MNRSCSANGALPPRPLTSVVRPLRVESFAYSLLQNSAASHILSQEHAISFNKITIVGNLGRDPELRRLPSGIPVCNFTIAVNETYRDKTGGLRTTPTWFRVSVWGERAAACAKKVKKGNPVYVAGRLRQREWEDDNGTQHYTLEVKANDVRFFGRVRSRTIKTDNKDGMIAIAWRGFGKQRSSETQRGLTKWCSGARGTGLTSMGLVEQIAHIPRAR